MTSATGLQACRRADWHDAASAVSEFSRGRLPPTAGAKKEPPRQPQVNNSSAADAALYESRWTVGGSRPRLNSFDRYAVEAIRYRVRQNSFIRTLNVSGLVTSNIGDGFNDTLGPLIRIPPCKIKNADLISQIDVLDS